MHHDRCKRRQILNYIIAVRNRIHTVSRRFCKTKQLRRVITVKRIGRTGQRTGAKRTVIHTVIDVAQAASVAEPAPAAPASVVEREVIREEDLAPEDRETLDGEKYSTPKQYAKPTAATEPLSSRIAVKDVVAKTELIEEPDGVTIKSVTERPATPAARYMEEANRPSALDARLMQREVASAPQATASAATQAQPQVETAGAPESSAKAAPHHLDEVPIELVHPNPNQPRMHFNKEELDELALSIEKDGLLQPILVREDAEGYEIIAGERRWQASQLAGLKKVPVRIKEADDMKVLELALIENLQRSDFKGSRLAGLSGHGKL